MSILSDEDSWLNASIPSLIGTLLQQGHRVHWTHSHRSLIGGSICFVLGYSRILDEAALAEHTNTVVVHESALPEGRGWSPLTWHVLDDRRQVTVTLLEAELAVDSGVIYAQTEIALRGDEFLAELRREQWSATRRLCEWFAENYPDSLLTARPQRGEPTYFSRRTPPDSCLDLEASLMSQIPLLRIVDNIRYPAHFDWRGRRVRIEVLPEERA